MLSLDFSRPLYYTIHMADTKRQATALKYNPDMDEAPIITAMGLGLVAEKIIERATEHDVPVVEDQDMSNILMQLSIGDAIPPKLYEAVAQILVFISQKDNSY